MSLQAGEPHLILASQSAARAAILRDAGLRFETLPAHIDEGEIKQGARADNVPADATAILLADMKTRRIARAAPHALIIGSDQMLVCEEEWFDKPADLTQAREQLHRLSGKAHILVTAVVCRIGEQRIWHHVARPKLTMRVLSDAFLDAYLALEGEMLTTTVGAYRLEGPGVQLFDAIDGEYAAILGLPLLPLLGFLRQHGVIVR